MALLQARGKRKPNTLDKIPKILEMSNKHGKSTETIAKELKMSRDTVRAVLMENSDMGTRAAIATVQRRLPAIAQMVTEEIIKRKDVDNGLLMLEKAGVFPDYTKTPVAFNDNKLTVAIQNLLPAQPSKDAPIPEAKQLPPVQEIEVAPNPPQEALA